MPTKEYRKPECNALEFTCPYCNKLTLHESISYEINTFSKGNVVFGNNDLFNYQQKYLWDGIDPLFVNKTPLVKNYIKKSYNALVDSRIVNILFITRICSKCGSRCYWEIISKIPNGVKLEECSLETNYEQEIKLIYPQKSSLDIEPNDDMDQEDKDLFNEAKKIFDDSPKAAGALLRSTLENIVKKVFKDKLSPEDKTLYLMLENQEVQKILISKEIKNICKACRLIGNKASHPLLIDMNDQKKEVGLLFKLINLVAKKIISDPLEEKNLSNEAEKIT